MDASSRAVRQRGLKLALSLAEEQGQEHYLRQCLAFVKKYEKKINRVIDKSGKRKRRESVKMKVIRDAKQCDETPRRSIKTLRSDLVFKIQNALKRHLLLKRARASFSIRATKAEYLALFSGYEDIHGFDHRKDIMDAYVHGESTARVVAKIGKVLGLKGDWWSRRCYGEDSTRTRDCAYIKIIKENKQRCNVRFRWQKKTISQVDAKGETHEVTFSQMRCYSFPRDCVAVRGKRTKAIQSAPTTSGSTTEPPVTTSKVSSA